MKHLENSPNGSGDGQNWQIYMVNKPVGRTPLECMRDFVAEYVAEYGAGRDLNLTYAGRLDPMAEGLLAFVDGKNLELKKYISSLDKTYEVEILLGVKTDSGDLLGLPKFASQNNLEKLYEKFNKDVIQPVLKQCEGSHNLEYPKYSSPNIKSVLKGKSKDSKKILPKKRIMNYEKIKYLKLLSMKQDELLNNVKEKISLVNGNFRQKEIVKKWELGITGVAGVDGRMLREFKILKVKVDCSSGAYMRTLAELVGKKLKINACAYSIKRTRVGEIYLED